MIGTTISHYRITEKLGEGGMGVVYKAEDTNLKRPVALKFLAPHLLGDEDVKARFRREAEAAAALNHPNICTVHEIGEVEGKTFIAMAFLEGEGLDKKIEAGPLKLKDALDIAIQTAQGLQAAQERGIVHRDIKPANLMVTGSGSKQRVTIMDFGLALLSDRSKLTRTDETMGTVTYMSPEQTYGMELDHRTDIWSLGVVIYEMVTGQQPFKGHYDKAVMYSITNEEPEPMTALRTGVPMELELLVNKCLAKDVDRRYQSTADMVVDLETLRDKLHSGRSTVLSTRGGTAKSRAARTLSPATFHSLETVPVPPTWKRSLPWAIAAITTLSLVALALVHFREAAPPEPPLRKFAYKGPASIPGDRAPSVAISPNGRHIAFVTESSNERAQLWVLDLGQPEPRLIAEDLYLDVPFWSPDSSSIGFTVGADAPELRTVSVQGGPSKVICQVPSGHRGGAWSPDGEVIVFSSRGRGGLDLYEVAASGGEPRPLDAMVGTDQSEEGIRNPRRGPRTPHFLPAGAGSRVLLYTNWLSPGEQILMIYDMTSGRREALEPGASPVYSPSGHVVFEAGSLETNLYAAPFSLASLRFTGQRFPIREDARFPSVAEDGTLVYLESRGDRMRQMVWRDRQGVKVGTVGQPQMGLVMPELSPDGRRVAVVSTETGNWDIWVHDVVRGGKQRLTFDPANDNRPVWLPRGDRISFTSRMQGRDAVYSRDADGTGDPELLFEEPGVGTYCYDWSADGRYAVCNLFQRGLYYLRRKDDGSGYEAHPAVREPFEAADLLSPKLSPNAKYLTYESNESGDYEVYVQPFPQGGAKVQVSVNGGRQPRWRGDGNEIFYVRGDTLMAVPVTTDAEFTVGTPEQLFDAVRGAFDDRGHRYTVTPDGQKFIIVEDAESDQDTGSTIQVTQNWFAEFQGRE